MSNGNLEAIFKHIKTGSWLDDVHILLAICLPGSLFLFVHKKTLFFTLDLAHWLFLSILISVPVFVVCRFLVESFGPSKRLLERVDELVVQHKTLKVSIDQAETELNDLTKQSKNAPEHTQATQSKLSHIKNDYNLLSEKISRFSGSNRMADILASRFALSASYFYALPSLIKLLLN